MSSRLKAKAILALAGAALAAMGVMPGMAVANGQPGVFAPGSSPYGSSYREWSAHWWQWAYSIPPADNPLFDETGAKCGQSQSGKVFYLVGVLNTSGTATRSCNVPKGKAVLFPILNAEFDNYLCVPGGPTTYTVKELRAQMKAIFDQATGVAATVDGASIDVSKFRFSSPRFDVTLPAENISCNPAGTYGPLVGDGWYVMLKPLSAGDHTVTFTGTLPPNVYPPNGFTLSISYTLHVA
jgi:hypothetical protein